MSICTFLESYDFSGKIITPFCTGSGNAMRGMEAEIPSCKRKTLFTTMVKSVFLYKRKPRDSRVVGKSLSGEQKIPSVLNYA